MSKSSSVGVMSGTCLLVIGACVYVTLAGEPAEVKTDAFADSLRFSSPRSELLSAAWNADDAKLDRSFLLAQAGEASGAPGISVQANNAGVSVGVSQEFSTWSDITAMFRPSRWKNPFREGGSLSWLNYKAWGNAPGRTGKVLLGEAIVAGATYAVIESTKGGGHHNSGGGSGSGSGSSSGSGSGSGSSSGELPFPGRV